MAAVSTQQSTPDQLEILLWRLLVGCAGSAPEAPYGGTVVTALVGGNPCSTAGSGFGRWEYSDLETLLRSLLPGNLAPAPRPRLGPISFRKP